MSKPQKFAAWIDRFPGGKSELARRLGVSWAAVNGWVTGIYCPRPDKARRIVDLSAGEITIDDIFPQSEKSA